MDLDQLYRKAAANDQAAESELFRILTARFRYFVRRKVWNEADCEEIVQTALASILKHYRTIEYKVGFAAWAQTIIGNKVTDYYRTEGTRKDVYSQTPEPGAFSRPENPHHDLRRRLLECLRKVNAANRRHARILVLKYQGFQVDEICQRLQMSKTNAYSALSRARSMLAICLEKGVVR